MREIIVEVDGVNTTIHVGPGEWVFGEKGDLVLTIAESRDLLTKLRLFSCIRDESEKQLLKDVWNTVMTDINNALAPYRKRNI